MRHTAPVQDMAPIQLNNHISLGYYEGRVAEQIRNVVEECQRDGDIQELVMKLVHDFDDAMTIPVKDY